MDKKHIQQLSEAEQRELAWEYVSKELTKRCQEKLEFAPTWTKTNSLHNGLIILETGCDCMGENHDLSIGIEHNREYNQAEISFWATMSCWYDTFDAWHDSYDAFKKRNGRHPETRWDDFIVWLTKWPRVIPIMWKRFKVACELFFHGTSEWEGGITFSTKEHIQDLIFSLWWGMERIERNNKSEGLE